MMVAVEVLGHCQNCSTSYMHRKWMDLPDLTNGISLLPPAGSTKPVCVCLLGNKWPALLGQAAAWLPVLLGLLIFVMFCKNMLSLNPHLP